MKELDGDVPEEPSENEMDEPLMDVDGVPDRIKLEGIIVQTISDLGKQHQIDEIQKVIRQRASDSGITYSSSEITEAIRAILAKEEEND